MEIIFIVFLYFSDEQVESMQFYRYDSYLKKNSNKAFVKCSEYIYKLHFQKKLQSGLKKKQFVRIGCVNGSKLDLMQPVFESARRWLVIDSKIKLNENQLYIPPVFKGASIIPDEKPLANWDVYNRRISLSKKKLRHIKTSLHTPEGRIVAFFQDIVLHKKDLQKHFSGKETKTISEIISKMKKGKNAFHKLEILAKLSKKLAKESDSSGNDLFAGKKIIGEIEKTYGRFDLIVFIETPPRSEDSFVLLKKEGRHYKIVSMFGWMHIPK